MYVKLKIISVLLSIFLIGCKGLNRRLENVNQEQFTYVLVKDWPRLPDSLIVGNPTGLGLDSYGNIWVFHRANRIWNETDTLDKIQDNTILALDKNTGQVLKSFWGNLFKMPHGLEIDGEDNIWVTDVALHQVFKFNKKGEILLVLGEANVSGNDYAHFNLPTDVAVTQDGSFYVSDGYGNSRIIKFSKEGKYLFEWGKYGSGQGEFNIPHGVDLDKKGNVYVADRENNRVQKFDCDGKFLADWVNKEPSKQLYSVCVDKRTQELFLIDYIKSEHTPSGSEIFRLDSNMNLQDHFGRTGLYNNPVLRYHDIQIDIDGNIYVGDILRNRIQKFKKINKQ